jgi:hypothetical protein
VATVVAVRNFADDNGRDMRDLTVADVHTYYVVAGTTPVLVHNCDGKATVNWAGGHASIDVEVNGQVVSTHRWGGPGTGTQPDYFHDPVSPRARRIEVDLPDGAAAQRYQHGTIDQEQGPYDVETNSCLTYCGDVLRAGGLDVPDTSTGLARWLIRNGRKVG